MPQSHGQCSEQVRQPGVVAKNYLPNIKLLADDLIPALPQIVSTERACLSFRTTSWLPSVDTAHHDLLVAYLHWTAGYCSSGFRSVTFTPPFKLTSDMIKIFGRPACVHARRLIFSAIMLKRHDHKKVDCPT